MPPPGPRKQREIGADSMIAYTVLNRSVRQKNSNQRSVAIKLSKIKKSIYRRVRRVLAEESRLLNLCVSPAPPAVKGLYLTELFSRINHWLLLFLFESL